MEGLPNVRKQWGPGDFTSGLVGVPFTIKHPCGVQDTAALVAGMLGFTVHRIPNSDEVSVQPFQGWSLMLSDDSPFCTANVFRNIFMQMWAGLKNVLAKISAI